MNIGGSLLITLPPTARPSPVTRPEREGRQRMYLPGGRTALPPTVVRKVFLRLKSVGALALGVVRALLAGLKARDQSANCSHDHHR